MSNQRKLTEIPEPPKKLNEEGVYYWYTYADVLISRDALYKSTLPALRDLCWWEQQKENHRIKLEEQQPVHEYYNEDGSLKHTQASGYFSNLKAIQSKVDKLRADLGLTAEKASQTKPGHHRGKSKSEVATGYNAKRTKDY